MNKIFTGVLLLVLGVGAWFLLKPQPVVEVSSTQETSKISVTTSVLKNYSEDALGEALENERVVLFFHAAWCPYCKEAEKDINENFSQLPVDLTILKVDYDTQTELKRKYEITTQHTFVQVDKNGNEIAKWVGGDVRDIIKNLK